MTNSRRNIVAAIALTITSFAPVAMQSAQAATPQDLAFQRYRSLERSAESAGPNRPMLVDMSQYQMREKLIYSE